MSTNRPWEALRRGLDESPALVAIMAGPDHVFEYTNPAYDALVGGRGYGRPAREMFPDFEGQGFFELLDLVFRTGESVRLEEQPIRYVKPGHTEPVDAWLTFTYSPWTDETGIAGVICTAVDVTNAVLTAERATETAELAVALAGEAEVATGAATKLQAVTADLTQALGVDDVLETVLAAGKDALSASTAYVALVDRGRGTLTLQRLRVSAPTPEDVALDSATPMATAARTGESLFLTDWDEIGSAFPDPVVVARLRERGERALVVVPLSVGDRVLGVLRFGMAHTTSPGPAVRAFILSLANHCALALERAQLARSEELARDQLAMSEERYRRLVEAISLDVWRADPTGALLTDMPAWRRLTGGTGDVRGDAWLDDIHPDDQQRVWDHWHECVAAQSVYDVEYRIRSVDGWRRIRSRGAPIVAADGTVLEWVGTTDDVTADHLAVERAVALQQIGEALVGAVTVADVEDVVVRLLGEIVSARAVAMARVDHESDEIPLRTSGYADDLGLRTKGGRSLPLLWEVIRTGRPHFMADESALRAGLVRLAGEDNAARIAASVVAAGDLSWCMLPLTTRGAPSGGITLGFPTPHAFDVAERTFLLTVASNVAVALQRAQLFEEQRTVATMLQRALQPRAADDADSGRSWVEQRTAPGADVGGDWAELLPLPDGATAVVLGDVMGRGVRAARMMAETRAAVRTLVALDPTPAFVLHGLDRFFASQGLDEIVTLFYGVLSADGSLECISAGHLPPLVVSSESAWFLDVPATPPLGVPHDGRVLHVDALRPGEAMVLYSDGLVESRTRSVGDGLDALCDAAKSADHSDPRELCLQLVDSLLAGAANDDDVTLLAVRLP